MVSRHHTNGQIPFTYIHYAAICGIMYMYIYPIRERKTMTTTLAIHGVQLYDDPSFTSPNIIMLIAGFAALLIGSLGIHKCLSCDESSHQSRHIVQVFFASIALITISLFIIAFSFFNFSHKDYDNNVAAFTSYGITESDADYSAFSFKHNVYYSTSEHYTERAIGIKSLSDNPQPGTYTYTSDDPVTGETYHMKITIDNSKILRVFTQKKQAHNNWVQVSPQQ